MIDKKLLVCIPYHNSPKRLKYLKKVINNLITYDMKVSIIIDTDSKSTYNLLKYYRNLRILLYKKLKHPYHLTYIHREHMKRLIDDYDYFMYTEDDILLPFDNFREYIENFKLLFPKFIPSFVRIEKSGNDNMVVDMQKPQSIKDSITVTIGKKKFLGLERPYHGFWIMPMKELKETMISDFIKYNTVREMAASYPIIELQKRPLVLLDKNKISKLCYSYHLPNNYVDMIGSEHKFGRIKVDEVLI